MQKHQEEGVAYIKSSIFVFAFGVNLKIGN